MVAAAGFGPKDAASDGSGGWSVPLLDGDMLFQDYASRGLRQYSGWVYEEFLRQLQGRQAATVYREMRDNSPVVGALLFSIVQSIRKIEWRTEPADDSPEAAKMAEFADGLRDDMSEPWDEFVAEALSMLPFGFAPLEIVYKRRLGRNNKPRTAGNQAPPWDNDSKYNDGLIGLKRLPLRGQDTILKWFFDVNGGILGLTQQPYVGQLIDLPIEKLLLFRPIWYKNDPMGRSILRNSFRPYYFIKRIEEQEAIMFERMCGFPVLKVPNRLLQDANAGIAEARASLNYFKKVVTNVRIDEQMGLILPSDTFRDVDGKMSNVPMYEFDLLTPKSGTLSVKSNEVLQRYNLDILKTSLADFIDLGHQARGTQNLAISKVDLFFQAIAGWVQAIAAVLNRDLLPRVWQLNGFDMALMPTYEANLPQRLDLDQWGNFVLHLSQAGMPLFPDKDLENYIRDASGMPTLTDEAEEGYGDVQRGTDTLDEDGEKQGAPATPEDTAKWLMLKAARMQKRNAAPVVVRAGTVSVAA